MSKRIFLFSCYWPLEPTQLRCFSWHIIPLQISTQNITPLTCSSFLSNSSNFCYHLFQNDFLFSQFSLYSFFGLECKRPKIPFQFPLVPGIANFFTHFSQLLIYDANSSIFILIYVIYIYHFRYAVYVSAGFNERLKFKRKQDWILLAKQYISTDIWIWVIRGQKYFHHSKAHTWLPI